MLVNIPFNDSRIIILCAAIASSFCPLGREVRAAENTVARIDGPIARMRAPSSFMRIRTIGYRLAKASALQCDVPTMQTGLILHDFAGFNEPDRKDAVRMHDLTSGFGILDLVPDSPAIHAGLRQGDEIMGVNGTDISLLAADAVGRRATYERVEAFEDLLQGELLRGRAILKVRRGQHYEEIALEAERGCGGRFTELNSGRLNAWSTGKYVTVSSAMLRFVADDSELAFVMAHEMAHNLLQHNSSQSTVKSLISSRKFRSKGSRAKELDADAYGLQIMISAGYEPQSAQRLLERTRTRSSQGLATTHPGTKRRIAVLDQVMSDLTSVPQIAGARRGEVFFKAFTFASLDRLASAWPLSQMHRQSPLLVKPGEFFPQFTTLSMPGSVARSITGPYSRVAQRAGPPDMAWLSNSLLDIRLYPRPLALAMSSRN